MPAGTVAVAQPAQTGSGSGALVFSGAIAATQAGPKVKATGVAPVPGPGHASLTDEMVAQAAGRAWFRFQVQEFQFNVLNKGAYRGDIYGYTGEGTTILDEMIAVALRVFPARTTIRLDFGVLFSDYREVDATDIRRVKTAYIAHWGNVNKPPVYPVLDW